MLNPSIDSLLEKVPSSYSLIILASKRAHEIEGHEFRHLESYDSATAVGKAFEEIAKGDVMIKEN